MQRLQRKEREEMAAAGNELQQHVADEGNVPGNGSASAIAFVLIFMLVSLGLIYFGMSYGTSQG